MSPFGQAPGDGSEQGRLNPGPLPAVAATPPEPSPASAWLFDAYPHPRKSCIVVWVKQGHSVTKRLVPYQPDFCVKAETLRLEAAEAALASDARVERTWRAKQRLWLRGPETEVLRIRPKRLQDTWSVATDLRQRTHTKGFLFFDVDHSQESRWMHANGLWSLCRLDGAALAGQVPQMPRTPQMTAPRQESEASVASEEARKSASGTLRLADGEDRWSVEYPDPELRTVRLEVTATKQGNVPTFSDPLASIRLGETVLECSKPGDTAAERDTLTVFSRLLDCLDPDVLVTRHGDRFDIPFLLHRIAALGLQDAVRLGRDPDPMPDKPDQAAKSIHTYGRWLFKTHAYYLRGRWHIDLSKKTLDSEDDRKDLHGIVYLARVSNRRAQDVNRNGAGFALQQMQIDLACDRGVALPWKRNLAEDWKDAATLCAVDRGGQIMVPQPGLYEDVAACDFSGYYPSLVVAHNLSSDTLNCACCPDGPVIPELGYHVCTKEQGHQSEILRRLWGHRRWAKAVLKRADTGPRPAPDAAPAPAAPRAPETKGPQHPGRGG